MTCQSAGSGAVRSLHVADAGTLARRAPSFSTPPGSTPIFLRGFTPNPWEHGAPAAEVLLREINPQALRYSPSREMHPAFSYLWRTCPTSGLDLPDDVAHENWFRNIAGMETWTAPSALGMKGSAASFSNVAWFVLTRLTAEATAKVLLDLGFQLDVVGARGTLNAQLASHVARRWPIGQGLIQVAKLGKIWLNPRCLRWVVRELAAASAASRRGSDVSVNVDAEAHLLAMEWFPHLLDGASQKSLTSFSPCGPRRRRVVEFIERTASAFVSTTPTRAT